MATRVTQADLRRNFRMTTLLCMLVGGVTFLCALVLGAAAPLVEPLLESPAFMRLPNSRLIAIVWRFSFRAAWIMAPLGAILLWAGVFGRKNMTPRGQQALVFAAYATVLGTIIMAVQWEIEVIRAQLGWDFHVLGIAMHGVQIVPAAAAALYFTKNEITAAVAGSDTDAPDEERAS